MQEISKIEKNKPAFNIYKILPFLSILYLTACQATTNPKISNITPSVQNSDYIPVAMQTTQPDYQSIETQPLKPNSTIQHTSQEVNSENTIQEEINIIEEKAISVNPKRNIIDLHTSEEVTLPTPEEDEPISQSNESIVKVERIPDIKEIPNPNDVNPDLSNNQTDSLLIVPVNPINQQLDSIDPNKSEDGLPEFDPTKRIMEGARKHSESRNIRNSRVPNVPAFRQLMNTGIQQLRNNQLSRAEDSFTKAQRIIPQSSAVYFYLGQIALKEGNPYRAEAFARRGLNVSDSKIRRSALWQIILKSAQAKGDKKTISEAKKALQ